MLVSFEEENEKIKILARGKDYFLGSVRMWTGLAVDRKE